MQYILVFLLSTCGAIVQSATGFGYGIFVMSFFPLFLPAVSSAAISTIASALLSLSIGWRFRKHINYRLALVPLVFFLVTNAIAIRLSVVSADSSLKRALGVFLICLSIYFIFFSDKIHIKGNFFTGAAAGLLSGIFGGFFGMGGPPIVLYLLSSTEDTEEYMGTIQFYFFLTALYSTAMRAVNGTVTPDVLVLSVVALLALLGGIQVGTMVFRRMNAQNLRRMVYGFMIVTGLLMLIQG